MKAPSTQRFEAQNYPGAPSWFIRFISDLNSFSETAVNIFTKNITPDDNIDCQIYTFTIVAGATALDNTTSFAANIKHIPRNIMVGSVINTSPYSSPVTGVTVAGGYTAPNIVITAINGLTAGQTYLITLFII